MTCRGKTFLKNGLVFIKAFDPKRIFIKRATIFLTKMKKNRRQQIKS